MIGIPFGIEEKKFDITRAEEREELTEEAVEQLLRAAEKGDAEAQLSLGYYYCAEAERKMEMFRNLPSGSPYMRAPFNLGERNPITEAARKDMERAFEWIDKSAKQGNIDALYRLSVCYLRGEGTPVFEQRAYDLLKRAADKGQIEAQYDLGMLYLSGSSNPQNQLNEFPRNTELAVKWLTRAAEQGDSLAQFQLGQYFDDAEDFVRAAQWYQRAAECEYPLTWALCRFGELLEQGQGAPKDQPRAAQMYLKAAKLGDAEGAYRLGRCYEEGIGVDADCALAAAWYQAAADNGSECAFDALNRLNG